MFEPSGESVEQIRSQKLKINDLQHRHRSGKFARTPSSFSGGGDGKVNVALVALIIIFVTASIAHQSFEFVPQQLELFPEFQPKPSYAKSPQLTMSPEALHSWKQRIFEHQQSESADQPRQGSLFELAPNSCDPNAIDPFALQLHNLSFCEKPDWGDRTCLYFVIDNAFRLVLYVGETDRTPKQRWMSHDCHKYIENYIELHRRYSLDVSVAIAFWYGAPTNRQHRLQLESELIYKWRSPFNKQCWHLWGQPFGK